MTTTEFGMGTEGQTIADPAGTHIASDRAFFGHPKGLGYLAGTELWERFSFYAMQPLLMLYMTKYSCCPRIRAGWPVSVSIAACSRRCSVR